MKRMLSFFMVLALLVSMIPAGPVSVWAATTVASGTCGDNLTWTLDDTGTLTISGTGAMKNYTYTYNACAPWYSKRSSVKKVVIGDSVTTIGDYAFYDCSSLTSVTIGNSVTTIGYAAFCDCDGLTSVTIPDSVTSIGDYAFYSCDGLTSVTIPDSVTTIGDYAFHDCTNLTSVTIGNSVETIGDYAFSKCYGLTSVTIPDSVTTIGNEAFCSCDGLTSVTIPDSVTTIGESAFYDTAWYKAQPNGLVYAGKVAYKYKGTCPSEVVIKEGTLGIAGSAFYDCNGLTSVTIPDSVTTIGDYAFYDCDGLTSVTIPDSVTTIGERAFYYCTGLTSVTIPNSVTTIGNWVFYSCSSLTSVTIPDSVTTIEEYAFYCCSGLTSVKIGNSVETIGDYAFSSCDGLTSVTIPDSVITIGGSAFSDCTNLTSVIIPDSVTTIGKYAFLSCRSLTEIEVDPNNENYSDIDGVLFSKDQKTIVCYPGGKSGAYSIPDSVTTIGEAAFYYCTGLTSVTIPDSVTTIGEHAFYSCDGLTSVTIPDSVTTIEEYAFYCCSGLTSVTIGNSVTSIGERAFSYCRGLTSVTIPDSVTTIGKYAFYGCTGLTEIYFDGSAPIIASNAFSGVTATAYYYPDETWTSDKLQNYGGTITWTARTCNHPSYGAWEQMDGTYHKRTCTVCKTHSETASHTWGTGVVTKAATCKDTGIMTYTCSACNATKTETISVTDDHVFVDWEKVDETNHKHTCTVCKTHFETAKHVPGEWIVDRAATCKQVGSQHQECTVCKATLKTAEIPLADHRYESEVTKAATCTEDGIITNTCTVCGHSYTVVVRAEHNYQPTARKEPTCTENGSITYTCSKCGDHYDETITAGHKYVAVITKKATATQNGEITYTCSVCGHSYTEVIPARPDAKVLLIQDTNPWQENNNVKLLNQMVKDGYLDGWDMVTTQFDADDLAGYSVILIANDQYSNTYSNLQQRQNLLVQFAQAGGTVIYGACDKGWANGDITYTLPGGVTSSNYYSRYNYIVNGGHPVVTGAATDGKALTNSLLYGNYCSHTAFGNLPEDAVVILQDGNGDPTLVEYALGEGHIILSGLTWEFYYTRAAYGGGDTTYTRNVYDDLVLYALQQSDPCIHVYEETKTVEPTCETNGYIVYTCKECGAVKTVTNADKLGHTYGDWEQVDETYHKRTCTVCKTHSETEKHNFGEDHVCTDCGYKAYTVGDFDSDGLVTDADVIWLLWYTVFPEDYPLNQSGDFDGDGLVTDADVIYLLWHTVFPEDYPIN